MTKKVTPLTPQQKKIIQKKANEGKPLTGIVTISLGVALQADLVMLFEENAERFNHSFSGFMRNGARCHLANGVDWHTNNQYDSKQDEILRAIQNLQFVEARPRPDAIKEKGKEPALNTEKGFSVE